MHFERAQTKSRRAVKFCLDECLVQMVMTCILMDTGQPYIRIQSICIAMTNPLIRLTW